MTENELINVATRNLLAALGVTVAELLEYQRSGVMPIKMRPLAAVGRPVDLNEWAAREAQRVGITPKSILRRYYKGHYPEMQIKRCGKQVFVVREGPYRPTHLPGPGEVPLKTWCQEQALRECVSRSGIYSRVLRGCYPGLRLRRKNQRVITVVLHEAVLAEKHEGN